MAVGDMCDAQEKRHSNIYESIKTRVLDAQVEPEVHTHYHVQEPPLGGPQV